jgi:hypothetical protein
MCRRSLGEDNIAEILVHEDLENKLFHLTGILNDTKSDNYDESDDHTVVIPPDSSSSGLLWYDITVSQGVTNVVCCPLQVDDGGSRFR